MMSGSHTGEPENKLWKGSNLPCQSSGVKITEANISPEHNMGGQEPPPPSAPSTSWRLSSCRWRPVMLVVAPNSSYRRNPLHHSSPPRYLPTWRFRYPWRLYWPLSPSFNGPCSTSAIMRSECDMEDLFGKRRRDTIPFPEVNNV